MIKYGVGGKKLKKPDNSELTLTGRGFVKRQKEEQQRLSVSNGAAKRLAKNRSTEPDKDILVYYSGLLADDLKNESEKNSK